jgi:hypothetical protein
MISSSVTHVKDKNGIVEVRFENASELKVGSDERDVGALLASY